MTFDEVSDHLDQQGAFEDGYCRECNTLHAADHPHDRDSWYYQYRFACLYGGTPTWRDAMAHCSDDVKAEALLSLSERGICIDEA
jgi:hypothetical protein